MKVKNKGSKNKPNPVNKEKIIVEVRPENVYYKYFCYLITLILPVITAYHYYQTALTTNQFLSFPLDDPWIHLTFARNIVEYFSFSYYKNELVTAGSTSPLYVFIAAVGFLISKNEMILSYILGTAFFALSSFCFYKLALKEFNDDILLSLLVCLVYVFDYWMNFIAVSGMETTMFIFLLLLGVYYYKSKNAIALGITLGLIFWARPDGIAFIGAIAADYIYSRLIAKNKETNKTFSLKEILIMSCILLVFLLAYFGMNLYLSGTILSNTYSAKVALNIDTDTRLHFLSFHIWNFFTTEHYIYFLPGFIIVFINLCTDIYKRRYNNNTIYIFFILLFILIYLIKLPMFSRFGRYFMPMLPFYIIVSMGGYYILFNLINRYLKKPVLIKAVNALVFISILIYSFFIYQNYSQFYATHCKYIHDRQVQTAYWFRDNTTDKDIIAAHDIGAIGYYSQRKIVDIAGLISPDLVKFSNRDDYNEILNQYFRDSGVTYTAFYREWFFLLNQNFVFNSPDDRADEALYVYKFDPEKSKVLPRKINYMMNEANKYIYQSDGSKMISSMNEILKVEPDYALAYFYKAYGYYFLNDRKGFEENIEKAIQIFPDFKDALIESGKIAMSKGDFGLAKLRFNSVIKLDPANKIALENLKSLTDNSKANVQSKNVNDLMIAAAKFIEEKNAQKIISSMNEVIKIDPEYSLAYFYRAYGHTIVEDYNNFEKDIQKSILLNPKFEEALIEYGRFLMNFGRFEEAKAKFNKVIEFDPVNKAALENLKSIDDTLKTLNSN